MRITWIGHSCFRIESNDYSLIIDPYEDDSVEGLSSLREKANMVLCTHEHGDHNFRDGIEITASTFCPLSIETIESFHDDAHGAKRGRNKIFIISDGKARIAHLGDLGAYPDDMESLKGLDVLLIPVGGFFTIDGATAADIVKKIRPRITVPMHYRDDEKGFGFDVLSTIEPFVKYFDSVSYLNESSVDSDDASKSGVIVLSPKALRNS